MLPASRNTNYDPGTPVKSADLNDIQDLLARFAPQWRWKIPILSTDTAGPWAGTAVSDGSGPALTSLVTSLFAIIPIDVVVGDTITDFGVNASPTGGSALVVSLHHNEQNGTDTQVATFSTALDVGGRVTMVGVAGSMPPHVVLDGGGYWIKVLGTSFTVAAAGVLSGIV